MFFFQNQFDYEVYGTVRKNDLNKIIWYHTKDIKCMHNFGCDNMTYMTNIIDKAWESTQIAQNDQYERESFDED